MFDELGDILKALNKVNENLKKVIELLEQREFRETKGKKK
jgi:hypothetical protein